MILSVATIRDTRTYVEPRYLLRWRLHYRDGCIEGPWSSDAVAASSRVTPGLLFASIEALDRQTKKVYHVARVVGDDFVEFRWVRVVKTPVNPEEVQAQLKADVVKLEGLIHGLILVSKTERITILMDGSVKIQHPSGRTTTWSNVKSSS